MRQYRPTMISLKRDEIPSRCIWNLTYCDADPAVFFARESSICYDRDLWIRFRFPARTRLNSFAGGLRGFLFGITVLNCPAE